MLRESETQMIKAEIIDHQALESVMDDYQGNLQLRSQQYEAAKKETTYEDEEEDDEYTMPDPTKEPTTRAVRYQSTNMYYRVSSKAVI